MFNDFGWSINDIPSSSNPLEIIIDENRTNITVSFKGNTKFYKLWDDDEIMLYARECTNSYTPQEIKYGYSLYDWNGLPPAFFGVLTNPNFEFKLNDIEIFNFYDFLKDNKFELKDNINLDDKNKSYEYNKIIKKLDENIITTMDNPFVFNPNVDNKYYNKYYRDSSFFFISTFTYRNLLFPSGLNYNVYFNFNSLYNSGLPDNPEWVMRYKYDEKPAYCYRLEGEIPKNNKIEFKITNNQRILNDSWIKFTTTFGKDYLDEQETKKIKYTHEFSANAEASVGLIKQNTYSEIQYKGRDITQDTTINGIAIKGFYHNTGFSHSDGLTKPNNITLDIKRSITVNSEYASKANVNQPAIAIVLWTKHEYQDNGSLYFVWKTIPNPIIPQHNSANIDLSKYYLTNGNPAFTASIAGGGFAQPTINGSILHIENQSATDTTTVIVNAILDNKRYETTFSILTK